MIFSGSLGLIALDSFRLCNFTVFLKTNLGYTSQIALRNKQLLVLIVIVVTDVF